MEGLSLLMELAGSLEDVKRPAARRIVGEVWHPTSTTTGPSHGSTGGVGDLTLAHKAGTNCGRSFEVDEDREQTVEREEAREHRSSEPRDQHTPTQETRTVASWASAAATKPPSFRISGGVQQVQTQEGQSAVVDNNSLRHHRRHRLHHDAHSSRTDHLATPYERNEEQQRLVQCATHAAPSSLSSSSAQSGLPAWAATAHSPVSLSLPSHAVHPLSATPHISVATPRQPQPSLEPLCPLPSPNRMASAWPPSSLLQATPPACQPQSPASPTLATLSARPDASLMFLQQQQLQFQLQQGYLEQQRLALAAAAYQDFLRAHPWPTTQIASDPRLQTIDLETYYRLASMMTDRTALGSVNSALIASVLSAGANGASTASTMPPPCLPVTPTTSNHALMGLASGLPPLMTAERPMGQVASTTQAQQASLFDFFLLLQQHSQQQQQQQLQQEQLLSASRGLPVVGGVTSMPIMVPSNNGSTSTVSSSEAGAGAPTGDVDHERHALKGKKDPMPQVALASSFQGCPVPTISGHNLAQPPFFDPLRLFPAAAVMRLGTLDASSAREAAYASGMDTNSVAQFLPQMEGEKQSTLTSSGRFSAPSACGTSKPLAHSSDQLTDPDWRSSSTPRYSTNTHKPRQKSFRPPQAATPSFARTSSLQASHPGPHASPSRSTTSSTSPSTSSFSHSSYSAATTTTTTTTRNSESGPSSSSHFTPTDPEAPSMSFAFKAKKHLVSIDSILKNCATDAASFLEAASATVQSHQNSSASHDWTSDSPTINNSLHATRVSTLAEEDLPWSATSCDTSGPFPPGVIPSQDSSDWLHSWQLNRRVISRWLLQAQQSSSSPRHTAIHIDDLIMDLCRFYSSDFDGSFVEFVLYHCRSPQLVQIKLADYRTAASLFVKFIDEAKEQNPSSHVLHIATSYFNCSSRKRETTTCGAKLNARLWYDTDSRTFTETVEGAKKTNLKNLHAPNCCAVHKSRLPPSINTIRLVDQLLTSGISPSAVEQEVRAKAVARVGPNAREDGRLIASLSIILARQRLNFPESASTQALVPSPESKTQILPTQENASSYPQASSIDRALPLSPDSVHISVDDTENSTTAGEEGEQDHSGLEAAYSPTNEYSGNSNSFLHRMPLFDAKEIESLQSKKRYAEQEPEGAPAPKLARLR